MYKVMLVDDEIYMLNGLKTIINWEEYGLEIVATASNGLNALEISRQLPIDIVLTDVKMPKMDGLKLIHALKAEKPSIKFIILSGYNDFDYVKEALKLGIENYLLKPINDEELSQTLLNIIKNLEATHLAHLRALEDSSILKNNILNRWISNTISMHELCERAQLLHLDLTASTYVICALQIINNQKSQVYDDFNDLRTKVSNICHTIFLNSFPNINHEVFCDFSGNILLYLSDTNTSLSYISLKDSLNMCILEITQKLKIDIFCTIGSLEADFHNLSLSYANATNLMEYLLILPPNSVLDYETKIKWNKELTNSISIQTDYFKNLLQTQNALELLTYIDALYQKAFECRSPSLIKHLSVELFYLMHKVQKDKGELSSYTEENSPDIYCFIYKLDDKTKLINFIKQSALNVMQFQHEEIPLHPLVKRTIDFIHSHLAEDISLKVLAAHFNINPSYLGQLFKNETGQLFTNYVHQVRIEKAKNLLCHSTLNANEIAIKVGYTNTNYFYTCFKKFTGKYPTDYRRENTLIK